MIAMETRTTFQNFTTYDQAILAALDGGTVYVRVPYCYPQRQILLRDQAAGAVRKKLEPLKAAVFKFKRDEVQFRSGGRIIFAIDRCEGRTWMEQDWARGITWAGGLTAYWPEDEVVWRRQPQ